MKELTGRLTAHAVVQLVDVNGNSTYRKIRIGNEFGRTLDESARMIANTREANARTPGVMHVEGRFIVDL